MPQSIRSTIRALALVGALCTLMWALGPDIDDVVEVIRRPQSVVDTEGADAVFLVVAQLGLVVVLGWLIVAVAFTAFAAALPVVALRAATEALTPVAMRRAIAVALGIGTLTVAACARPASQAPSVPATSPIYAASSDVFDWPAPPVAPVEPPPASPALPEPSASSPAGPSDVYVVETGDCLWSIANRSLGGVASIHEVAELVDALYAANAPQIGPDPDLLTPGSTLVLPAI